ncbi:MAG: beta-N-acetylglucosaminidase domain-containing protein [Candidatus Zipacnadales bacterium]
MNTGLPGGRRERETYLRKLEHLVPPEVLIIWTGPVTRSLEITQEQIDGFTRVLGRRPFLWDNTVYAHRSRYGYDTQHLVYLFDTFETRYPAASTRTRPASFSMVESAKYTVWHA